MIRPHKDSQTVGVNPSGTVTDYKPESDTAKSVTNAITAPKVGPNEVDGTVKIDNTLE